MHPTIREFEASRQKAKDFDFRPGDTVRVSVRIVEGEKERIQDFEGVCIRRKGGGMGETFTVRRFSYGVGMERVFPLNSPRVEDIKVIRRGKVRRAHLTYLRQRRGKQARVTEDLLRSRKIARKGQEMRQAEAAAESAMQAKQAAAAQAEAEAREEAPAEAQVEETPAGNTEAASEEKPANE
ncbi:MAG: 50S ribosomal protein L19 [Candidatus Sumerlaeia bacterium]